MSSPLISRFRSSAFAFPLAALTALAMFFISEASYRQATDSLDGLGEMGKTRTDIQDVRRGLTDAETGQRGYLLTGRKEYLQPYTDALDSVHGKLDALQGYYAGDPVGAALAKQLRALADEKLSELSTSIQLRDQGKEEAWRDLLSTNIGQEKMDQVRNVSDQLLTLETAKVEAGRESVYQTLLLNRIGVSAMTALSLLALYMYLRQTDALLQQRLSLATAVKAERDQLEAEVKRRTAQLTELAQHLQTVREDERNRLARELHDELGALLTAAKLDVARLKSRLGNPTPEVADRLKHLNEALNNGIALKRRIVEDLRPSSLSNLGLVAALDILVREFDERVDMEVRSDLGEVRLTPSGELTAYRLVQEALTNAAKYAAATRIQVTLGTREGKVSISVQDDGGGFDPKQTRSTAHGLLGMRYRVEAEGGVMRLVSAPGEGTRIEAELPEGPSAAADAGAAEPSAPSYTL